MSMAGISQGVLDAIASMQQQAAQKQDMQIRQLQIQKQMEALTPSPAWVPPSQPNAMPPQAPQPSIPPQGAQPPAPPQPPIQPSPPQAAPAPAPGQASVSKPPQTIPPYQTVGSLQQRPPMQPSPPQGPPAVQPSQPQADIPDFAMYEKDLYQKAAQMPTSEQRGLFLAENLPRAKMMDDEIKQKWTAIQDANKAARQAYQDKLKESAPASDIGKLQEDLKRGLITKQEYEAEVKRKIAPTINMIDASSGKAGAGLDFAVKMALAGDSSFSSGWARSPQLRMQYLTRMAELAKEANLSPKDVAAATAEFTGMKAGERTLGTRQANIDLAANVFQQFAPLARAASADYKRSNIKSVNDLKMAVDKRTASPELRKLNASVNAIINSYARAVSPNGVPTISDKDHAREILDSAFSNGDFNAAIDQMTLEMGAELKAPGAVKSQMRGFFTGKESPTPTSSNSAPAEAIAYLKAHPELKDKFKAKYGYLP